MPLARSRAMARDGAWYQALARALNSGHRSVGTLTARLRIRCARQRCRAERGKHSSIARMIPGAPSETTSSGSPRPRPRMSWKKARTVSVSSFDPAIRCSRTLPPASPMPQAARTGSRAWPARSALGDAVHEEIDDPILAEVTRRERLVLGPQPLGDLAHARPAQQPTSGFVRERVFDVARRQSACVELNRQVLERAGPTRQVLSDPRHERFSRVANLRRHELDHALRCLHPTRPIPVPVTTRLAVSPLVALAPDLVPHLGFERLFHDQLRCQEHQARTIRGRPQPTIHQGPKALACPLRRGYSLHWDAPCWAPAPNRKPDS